MTSAGADLNASDDSGVNALMEAAAYGSADVVEFLLDQGSDINVSDHHGRSVLHRAVMNKRVEESRTMMARDLKYKSSVGIGLMRQIAGSRLQHDATKASDVVNLLLERGAQVSAPDSDDSTPLHLAAERGLVAVVATLLRNGADIFARNHAGFDALSLAQNAKYESIVQILQQSG